MSIYLGRAPRDDDELYELVHLLWGVYIPRHAVCPDHVSPFEAFADAYFARSPVAVWKASRGFGGKSRTLAYLTLTEAVTLGAEINLLGGSGAQSQNIHEAMQDGWTSPVGSKLYESLVRNETQIYTYLNNGAKIKALMASQRSVRGPHPQRLRMDEIDEMDEEILWSAFGQPMAKGGIEQHIVLSSTHQYPDKTMSAMLDKAKEKDWPVFEWCWRESSNEKDGWLTKSMIERKKQEVSQRMWEVEYDLQEPTIGSRAFDTDKVEKVFGGWCTHPDEIRPAQTRYYPDECPYEECDHPARKVYKRELKSQRGEFYEFEDPDTRNGEYITGADWAKEKDFTVIWTIRVDQQPARLVAYARLNRKPYPMMIKLFNERLKRYPGGAIHDGTGLGNVVNDYIDQRSRSFIMTGRARDDMLSEYVNAVEKESFRFPKIETAYSAHKYCSLEDLYGRGKDTHLPDEVCAAALASFQQDRNPVVSVPALDITNDGSYWAGVG